MHRCHRFIDVTILTGVNNHIKLCRQVWFTYQFPFSHIKLQKKNPANSKGFNGAADSGIYCSRSPPCSIPSLQQNPIDNQCVDLHGLYSTTLQIPSQSSGPDYVFLQTEVQRSPMVHDMQVLCAPGAQRTWMSLCSRAQRTWLDASCVVLCMLRHTLLY